jgi:C-terminal processing protease CtpA/Prc
MDSRILRKHSWILILAVSFLAACNDDLIISDEELVNKSLYTTMKNIYLWYDKLPSVNPLYYSTPYELMEALRYKELDRWSFVLTWHEYDQYFQEGKMIGHGFMISRDEDYNLRIAFVYPSTLAYSKGVRRGWIITKVNGVPASQSNVIQLLGTGSTDVENTIEFIDNDNVYRTITLKKEELKINPVLHSEIIHVFDKKIGYIVFQDFIDAANIRIDSAFSYFKQENVDDLILDLRYNGGGSVDVAVHLSGWLTGNVNAEKTLINIQHNDRNRQRDTSFTVPYNGSSLDLARIVFIGTSATASASELIINGMTPYMDVSLIGAPTNGKPVGMYVLEYEDKDYAAFPVCFKYTNALDVGDFYNGLQPDVLVNDDLTRDFGDPDEGMLKAAINYITSETMVVVAKKTTSDIRIISPSTNLSELQRAF